VASIRGFFQKSFLERNHRIIGLLGLGALFGGSAFALLLSGGVFAHTYRVTAYFSDAAGITPGDKVTVAGLDAGTVKAVRIQGGRVAMDLGVNKGIDLPSDSRADVVIETLLGRESVNLTAGQSGQLLQDGSSIPLSRTTTPVSINELNDISVNLMNRSNANALNELMREVTRITAGKTIQVRQLVTGLASVAQAINERRGQLSHLLDSLRTLSTTLGNKSGAIVSMIDNLNPILTNLAHRQQAIATLLEATDSASHTTASLVSRNRKVLDSTLEALHQDLMVLDQHQVDLAATIDYLDQSVQGYSSVGYSQGVPNRWANIFVQSLGPLGVDAILGQCGLVDQFIDQILGSGCQSAPPLSAGLPGLPQLPGLPALPGLGLPGLPGANGGLPVLPTVPPLPIPTTIPPLPIPSLTPLPSLPVPTPSLPLGLHSQDSSSRSLGGDVGDMVDSALAGSDSRGAAPAKGGPRP